MVNVYLAQGFEEVEAISVIDMLRRAGVEVNTVSVEGEFVTGAHNITIKADMLIGEEKPSEMIFLPGGMPGVTNLLNCEALREILVKHNSDGKMIAAICAAPMILGRLGIVNGKKAVCYPGFEDELKGAEVLFDNVCVSSNIITSRGAGTALELSYELIKILKSYQKADDIKKGIIDNR